MNELTKEEALYLRYLMELDRGNNDFVEKNRTTKKYLKLHTKLSHIIGGRNELCNCGKNAGFHKKQNNCEVIK